MSTFRCLRTLIDGVTHLDEHVSTNVIKEKKLVLADQLAYRSQPTIVWP